MIPKAEFLTWIDDYCLDQLSEIEKGEFEEELENNIELQEELRLQKEILSAITETDVIKLREKLEIAAKINTTNKLDASFDLLDDFADIHELTDSFSPKDLINFYDSLPKVHVYQHQLVSNENITEFYKEQGNIEYNEEENFLDDVDDFSEFEGLEEAVLETDVLNLRDTLAQVAKSVQSQFSTEDIDKYLHQEMSAKELELFESELQKNPSLQEEIELHKELELAIQEDDIQRLRAQLSGIIETETSWKVSEQNMDDFLEGILEGRELEEFNEELSHNTDLMAELKFQRELEESVNEKDIFELRDKIGIARKNVEITELKTFVPTSDSKFIHKIKQVAAVAVIVLGVSSALNYVLSPLENTYDKYYQTYTVSAERSISSESDAYLSEANNFFLNGEYSKALAILKNAEKQETETFVYSYKIGAIEQMEQHFKDAINEYDKVLAHGDNLFIEEAEWNKGLCLVKLGKKELAKIQMEAVINRNSYYKNDAKAILRKLKYSVKK